MDGVGNKAFPAWPEVEEPGRRATDGIESVEEGFVNEGRVEVEADCP